MILYDCCSILKVSSLLTGIIVAFFYPNTKIYMQLPMFQIYFMAFVMQQIFTIKIKIANYHWCLQPNVIPIIPIKKWFENFFDNFIWFIINHIFYVITPWMHYTIYTNVLEEIKLIATFNWIFHASDFLR